MVKITKVKRGSLAKELGLEVGDEIVALDNFPCVDELDYLYYMGMESFSLTVRDHRSGEQMTVDIEKDEDEDLGVEIEKTEKIRTCHNRCVFCFVDQMPCNMRESLYVKDDDYTMSFTCGNFVTLTNVSDEEIQRIVRLKLSPLYVSVHTMNPNLRVKLMRNRFAGKIVSQIDTLAKGGINLHCQAVILPNENDGEELKYTARALFKYYPTVRDLACVPTGLTRYRDGLYPIADIDREYSKNLLKIVDELNEEFGVNFVLPADEYFVKAGLPVKETAFYGDFEQIENGVGLTRKFLSEVDQALEKEKRALKTPKTSLLVCGVSAAKTLAPIVEQCEKAITGLQLKLLPVVNTFFGETVTCTGLLTGQDILSAVQQYTKNGNTYDEILLAGNTMKEFEDVFLCGMTLDEMKKNLATNAIRVNRGGGFGLVEILCKENT